MNKRLVPRGTQNEELSREVVEKTFNPAGMDFAHLEKMTAMRTAKKLSLRGKRP